MPDCLMWVLLSHHSPKIRDGEQHTRTLCHVIHEILDSNVNELGQSCPSKHPLAGGGSHLLAGRGSNSPLADVDVDARGLVGVDRCDTSSDDSDIVPLPAEDERNQGATVDDAHAVGLTGRHLELLMCAACVEWDGQGRSVVEDANGERPAISQRMCFK